jgi:WD40 repeat protein
MSLYNDLLVSGNADSTVRVWNIRDGQNVYTLAGPHKHESAVTSLALLPHAGLLVTSSDDGTAKLWDVNQGECVYALAHELTRPCRHVCARLNPTADGWSTGRLYLEAKGNAESTRVRRGFA